MTASLDAGSCETMSLRDWVSKVVEAAHVSMEDMECTCTRARLHSWFHAGEPVWMAADSLRTWVRQVTSAERGYHEVDELRAALRRFS